MDKLVFSVWDYVVFVVCLLFSMLIGFKYACTGGKQRTTDEFLMANRKMKYAPVALSLMVSFISAVTILGVPAEIYNNGIEYCFLAISYFICFPVVAHIFIPVFYKLQITSVYEYLELRFSRSVRIAGTITYMVMLVIYMGVVLYTPAIALNAVTNIDVWTTVVVLCVVCMIYTSLGGLKAVIWTDVFQAVVMLGGQIVVIVIGVTNVGGLGNVWEINKNANKTTFARLDLSPFERHTVWTLGIGGAFMCMTLYGTSQTAVQRYLSCQTERDAKITAYLNLPLLIVVMIISGLMGMTIYATYHCDNPLASGAITKPDQLLIYYVMDLFGGYPGLPGLFISCLFSAALSTISSCFNALATLTMKDLILPCIKLSERKATICSKLVAAGYGIVCLVMSAIASTMGSVLIAAISIFGIMGGPLLGLFILGIFFRSANARGAFVGFLISLLLIFLVGFGSIAYFILYVPPKVYELSDQICSNNSSNFTSFSSNRETTMSPIANWTTFPVYASNITIIPIYSGPSYMFKLSYMWYSGFSALVVLIVGLLSSFCFKHSDSNPIDERTLHPCIRRSLCYRENQNENHELGKNFKVSLDPGAEEKISMLDTQLS